MATTLDKEHLRVETGEMAETRYEIQESSISCQADLGIVAQAHQLMLLQTSQQKSGQLARVVEAKRLSRNQNKMKLEERVEAGTISATALLRSIENHQHRVVEEKMKRSKRRRKDRRVDIATQPLDQPVT